VKDGKQLIGEDIPSPSMVKGGKGSPWARASGLKGKRRMFVFLGYVQMCEKNVSIGT
jgi:hypothetical protein